MAMECISFPNCFAINLQTILAIYPQNLNRFISIHQFIKKYPISIHQFIKKIINYFLFFSRKVGRRAWAMPPPWGYIMQQCSNFFNFKPYYF